MKFIKQGMTALIGVGIACIGSVSLAQDIDFERVEIETIPTKLLKVNPMLSIDGAEILVKPPSVIYLAGGLKKL